MKQARPAPERCGAKSKSTGQECRAWKVVGGKRCKFHGGASPQAKRAAERRLADMQLQSVFNQLHIMPVTNPLEALRELAGEVTAWKNLMAAHVGRLLNGDDQDDEVDDEFDDEVDEEEGAGKRPARRGEGLRYASFNGGEQLRGEVLLFERAMDRCLAALATIAKLNIDERLAAITDRQVDAFERALLATLDEMDIDRDDQKRALRLLSGHLVHHRDPERATA